jgi:hypothetical protein
MSFCREGGRSCASCARGIRTSLYSTKDAKRKKEPKLPISAEVRGLEKTSLGLSLLRFVFLCVLCVFAANIHMGISSAQADDWQVGGHAKYQFTYTDYRVEDLYATVGDDPARDNAVDVRFKAERRVEAWDVAAHLEMLGIAGDSVAVRRQLAAAGFTSADTISGLPDDRRRLFDLTHESGDRSRSATVYRLDRLAVGYTSDRGVLRFGRQAVSWGNGLAFQALDFVNPFSPVAVDKDYKTGDDMLYGQWITGGAGDVQAIVLPRRDPDSRRVERAQSSLAAKWRLRGEGFDLDLLVARHYDENLAGIGVVRSVGGAVWRFDASRSNLSAGGHATWIVTNLDYSWTWAGQNVYGFVEYFHSGVGESDRADYAAPNAELVARIRRGELFTLARDYAVVGLQVELAPLVNVFGNVIRNLSDGSRYVQWRVVYDWREDVRLMAGVNLPGGERGSEYGGIATGLPGLYNASGTSWYGRMAWYF